MYELIIKLLLSLDINFDEIEHEETTSCEHSAILREKAGLVGIGSKNIIFHAKGIFYLVTTLGTKDIKARLFKKEFQTKDIRFANQQEITQIGLGTIGSIAPFGYLNNGIKIFVDSEIFQNDFFMFNPGNPKKTIRIKTSDLKKVYEHIENQVKYFTILEDGILIQD